LNIQDSSATLALDNKKFPDNIFSESANPKFGTDVASRLQAEIISIHPPEHGIIPSHKAYFKNWSWLWKK